VLESEDIHLCSWNEITLVINLFDLGMSYNINLDFSVRDTLNVWVDGKAHFGFSLPVTGKILELGSVGGSGGLLGDFTQGVDTRSNPHLRTQECKSFASFKDHMKLAIHDAHTDFSGLDGLLIASGHNRVTFTGTGRVQIDFRFHSGGTLKFGRLGRTSPTFALDSHVEPTHPGISKVKRMFVGK